MKKNLGKIHVDPSIRALPFADRKRPPLVLNRVYFVSFGNNNVYPCIMQKKSKEGDRVAVTIAIPSKIENEKGFKDINGKMSNDWNTVHTIYSDEIGWTPKQAVENTVG